MNKDKMKKTASTIYLIVNIIQKLLLFITAVVALAAGVLAFLKEIPEGAVTTSLSLGNVTMELAEGAASSPVLQKTGLMFTLVSIIVMLLMIVYGLGIVRKILRPMREGTPFDTSVSLSLKRLGYVVLIGGILSQVLAACAVRYTTDSVYILKQILKEGTVTNITYHYSFSLEFLIAALFLFLLSYVFRYGEELQKESDETL